MRAILCAAVLASSPLERTLGQLMMVFACGTSGATLVWGLTTLALGLYALRRGTAIWRIASALNGIAIFVVAGLPTWAAVAMTDEDELVWVYGFFFVLASVLAISGVFGVAVALVAGPPRDDADG